MAIISIRAIRVFLFSIMLLQIFIIHSTGSYPPGWKG